MDILNRPDNIYRHIDNKNISMIIFDDDFYLTTSIYLPGHFSWP